MPRPNPPRTIAGEQAVARRMAYERERRGMTYAGLASRMRQAGCPIQDSALFKIEKGDPPRRITVDELLALSTVFEIPLAEFITPLDRHLDEESERLIDAVCSASYAAHEGSLRYERAVRELADHLIRHPELAYAFRKEAETHDEPWMIDGLIGALSDPYPIVPDESDAVRVSKLEELRRG